MPSFTHATAQGGRSDQQDRYVTAEITGPLPGTLLAVMDGHGGARTAEILATHLAALFQLAIIQHAGDVLESLRQTVRRLNQRTAIEASGSTLSVVFIPQKQDKVYAAVLGDSPVLIQTDSSLWISPMHNARTHVGERQAALNRGARYSGGYLEDPQSHDHGLQMSRALGDRSLARILHREPELFSLPFPTGGWVLLATDGVLDGADLDFDRQLKDLAGRIFQGMDANALVNDAVQRATGDNVTVLLWKDS